MRLSHPRLSDGERVVFSFEGRAIEGLAGESIAAALSAAGVTSFRSFRDGSPRGLWCGMGACFECVVTVDGRGGQRACLEKIAPGMAVTGPSGTAPTADLAAAAEARPPDTEVDAAIVGAGPAGLTAGSLMAEAGLEVLVLDERPDPGGQYYKPVAASHGEPQGPLDAQFAEGAALRRRFQASGARIWQGAGVWSAFAPGEIAVLHEGRHRLVRPKRLLLAPGAYERPVPIPGWTLPGVMTTGSAQTLARSYRVFPGRRAVIGGNGPLNLQLAVELVAAGVEVLAVAEEAPRPGPAGVADALRLALAAPGLAAKGAGYLARLRLAGVPVLWGSRVVAAEGDGALASVTVATPAGERRFAAEVLALGHGFIPSVELARQLGCRHRFVDRHVGYLATETGEDGRTSLPEVFAVGDGADPGGSVVARTRGVLAADAILRDLGKGGVPPAARTAAARELASARRFQAALWSIYRAPAFEVEAITDDTVVCRCEGVTAGGLRAKLGAQGADAGIAKRLTRAGMGRCQGRNCGAVIARLVAAAGGAPPEPLAFFAPRPATKPVPLAALAFEKPEWGGHRRAVPPPAHPRPARARPDWGERRTGTLVIGAGVVGACVARELALAGEEVLVVDRDAVGQQASTANAGSLHVQLLSFDFGRKAEAGGGPAAETLRLGPPAIALWREIAEQSGEDLDIRITGGLMVAESEREIAFLRAKAELEGRYGVETHILDGAELRRLEPHLSERLIGAAYCPAEGKIDPLQATFAVAGLARAAGATFETDAPVTAITREDAGFTVETAAGRVKARRVVNCAGAWSSHVSAMVGAPVPMHGAPLQMLVTEPGPKVVSRLIAHADRHLSLKQTQVGSLLIGGGWSAGLDERSGASTSLGWAIEGNSWVACRVLPAARRFHLLRAWAGMNINIDGAPIIGEMPGVPGFYNCVTSNGFTLAPIVARLSADLMLGRRSDWPTAPFTLSRF